MTHAERTDAVAPKLELFRKAYESGRFDLAMSFVESIKDTLQFERQLAARAPEVQDGRGAQIGRGDAVEVKALPPAGAAWAAGWHYAVPIAVFETVGIERRREPLECVVSFDAGEVEDLAREVRVARIDADGSLFEVPSQVHGEVRRGEVRTAVLLFAADVPLHGASHYLLFYGNPWAERPCYATDLCVRGEGYALDVSNRHYTARLSRQMGQLERLTYARQHSLELYAGGKGHGEPPTIDWAHDYVDEGGFQKLRIKNWAACPDFAVIQGPLLVEVRRWGFPHSPVHPVFTPSRLHVDVTYRFHAGLPYFFKEGSMEAVQDLEIEAMRDDEWVFSGYSFSDTLWLDAGGKVHEGPVPEEGRSDLWGAGFYHRVSRDSFLALWLEHEVKNHAEIRHGGAPTLHYDGHGQLWSRYPAERAHLAAGTVFRQRNAYLVSPYPEEGGPEHIARLRHQLLHPLEARAEPPPRWNGRAKAQGSLARPGETAGSGALKSEVWKRLREVEDEQLYTAKLNIVDMGLVYDLRLRGSTVHVLLTMPHRGRPVHEFFASQGGGRLSEGIRERLLKIPGVDEVVVDLTWNPPWTVARLSDAGREALGLPEV